MSWLSGWWKKDEKEEKPVLKDDQIFLNRKDVKENRNYANTNSSNWTDEYGYGFLEAIYKQFKANKYLSYSIGSEAINFYYTGQPLGASGGFSYRFIFENIIINNKEILEVRDTNSKNYTKVWYNFQNSNTGYQSLTLDTLGKKREYRADKVSIILEQTKNANIMFSERDKININKFSRETEDENKRVYLTVNYGLDIRDYLMINGICPDFNTNSKDKIKITVSGEIPLWVYENLLPLSTKGYIDEQGNVVEDNYTGTKYKILGINDAFYENIESSINFGERTDIDFERFKNFYVKNVKLSIDYYGQILPFKYWEDGVLKDSNIEYYSNESEDIASISNVDYILTIHFNPQNENDFLDKYIKEENGNKILVFNVSSTNLNEDVQSLTDYSFRGNLIIIDQMIREENGSVFTIECCSEQIQGIHIIYSTETNTTGTIECSVSPDYKINNLYCINTNDLDLNDELPEIELTLSTQDYITLKYDNLYLTNLKKNGATNTNLLLEGDITSLYQYLPLKKDEYPEGYPELLKGVDTINDSPVPNEYLDANISMCLINIEDANDIDISKFGITKNGEFEQNVFISLITAYRSEAIIQKLTNSGLKSRNQVVTHGETLGDGEVVYDDTRYRFGNPNLVQSITNSDETNYDAIQLYFANQYNNEFLNDEITKDGDDWNIIIDLNNKPTDPNDPESPSTSDQFRNMMDSNDSLLLFVKRLETIGDITFWNGKNVTNVQIYYYDENGEYISEPKTFTNFKTKIADAYWAATYEESNKTYLIPTYNYFNTESNTIKVSYFSTYLNKIDIINNLYMTGAKVYNNNLMRVIRSQKINLFVNGTIPAWVFKEVLPLAVKVGTETHFRFIKSDGTIYLSNIHGVDDVQIIGINDKPNMENVLFPTIDPNGEQYLGSSIDLSNISDGTAVANKDVFDRMFIGTNKVFFVNKVTLLERFKEKINIEGIFQYYEGEPTEAKNCNPNKGEIVYVNDWAVKLPECSCEINDTSLNLIFNKYKQIGKDNYLLKDIVRNYNLYLDVSILTTVDLSGINIINLNLNELKCINNGNCHINLIPSINIGNSIYLYYNSNGFIKMKLMSELYSNIDTCYAINGENREENISGKSIQLIIPKKDVFSKQDSKKCIILKNNLTKPSRVTVKHLKVTNLCGYNSIVNDDEYIENLNLLVAGEIPTWIMEYMPLPINIKFLEQNSTHEYIYELTKEDDYDLQIISVNALPTPDGDIGIDNIN